jgi:O-antigen ligase
LIRSDALLYVVGALLTVVFTYEASAHGSSTSLGVLLAVGFFAAATYAFLANPPLAVALTIPFFALLPAAKVLVNPRLGPAKDAIVLAAVLAALITGATRRRAGVAVVDRWLLTATLLFLFLYVVNVAGRHDLAWFHGLRLAAEPVLLLLAGLVLPQPRKTLRWAVASLVVTGCFVAGVGLLEQVVGQYRLAGYGFQFNLQIRTIQGHLRSFGTMDEPFAYASFLALALAALVFARRRTFAIGAAACVILTGLAVSYVRTAVLILFAFLALELARRGRAAVAAALAATLVVIAVLLVVQSQGTESRTFANPGGSAAITLNGRTAAWRTALGSPVDWPLGRGVGEVGTAAERAGYTIVVSPGATQKSSLAVDSGYFATVADVGIVGLLVLFAIFGRIALLAQDYIRRGAREGWLVLGVLAALMIDALTRSSFVGFPSAFLEMFVLGIALSAARESALAQTP